MPGPEADRQAEVLAEEAMGVSEADGDVPEPLYPAGRGSVLLMVSKGYSITARSQLGMCSIA